jgi:hypothetical protein
MISDVFLVKLRLCGVGLTALQKMDGQGYVDRALFPREEERRK